MTAQRASPVSWATLLVRPAPVEAAQLVWAFLWNSQATTPQIIYCPVSHIQRPWVATADQALLLPSLALVPWRFSRLTHAHGFLLALDCTLKECATCHRVRRLPPCPAMPVDALQAPFPCNLCLMDAALEASLCRVQGCAVSNAPRCSIADTLWDSTCCFAAPSQAINLTLRGWRLQPLHKHLAKLATCLLAPSQQLEIQPSRH